MTAEQILACDFINAEFPKYQKQLFSTVTFENLVSEAHSLNAIESAVPSEISLGIHFDKIFESAGNRVKDYYTNLSLGKNQILEEARALGLTTQQINEAIDDFRNFIKHKLFEEAMALGAPVEGTMDGFGTALSGGEKKAPAAGSKWTIFGSAVRRSCKRSAMAPMAGSPGSPSWTPMGRHLRPPMIRNRERISVSRQNPRV